MRGQPLDHINKLVDGRIIPARAGPTRDFSATECPGTDHPRSCGANAVCDIGCKLCCGSSPLVRGQLNVFLGFFHQLRIIPARAGPTDCLILVISRIADHPRSCGANFRHPVCQTMRFGSSPLVRGQPNDIASRPCLERIIPARAGPTISHAMCFIISSDHPRSCGANLIANIRSVYGDGSSPLVRGQLEQLRDILSRVRIIPARAGPTGASSKAFRRHPDHPRSCGANSLILRGKSGLSQIKIFDYSSGIWQ